jgi:hypothetical protein
LGKSLADAVALASSDNKTAIEILLAVAAAIV